MAMIDEGGMQEDKHERANQERGSVQSVQI